jgi:hypothetical protein
MLGDLWVISCWLPTNEDQLRSDSMENRQDQPERVTIRIQEEEEAANNAAPTPVSEPSETKVVFIENRKEMAACYYQGYHDGFGDVKFVIMFLAMAVTFLSFLLVRNASE